MKKKTPYTAVTLQITRLQTFTANLVLCWVLEHSFFYMFFPLVIFWRLQSNIELDEEKEDAVKL